MVEESSTWRCRAFAQTPPAPCCSMNVPTKLSHCGNKDTNAHTRAQTHTETYPGASSCCETINHNDVLDSAARDALHTSAPPPLAVSTLFRPSGRRIMHVIGRTRRRGTRSSGSSLRLQLAVRSVLLGTTELRAGGERKIEKKKRTEKKKRYFSSV